MNKKGIFDTALTILIIIVALIAVLSLTIWLGGSSLKFLIGLGILFAAGFLLFNGVTESDAGLVFVLLLSIIGIILMFFPGIIEVLAASKMNVLNIGR